MGGSAEEPRGSGTALGTTRRGIGPAYADRYGRWGIRLADLSRPSELAEPASRCSTLGRPTCPGLPTGPALQASLSEVGGRLAPYIRPTEPILWGAIERAEPILLEGAQSALLDVDFGTYPYVTSSHPTSAGALVGSGIPPTEVDQVIGVSKAYATRVGTGPFPTEIGGELGEYLRREGGGAGCDDRAIAAVRMDRPRPIAVCLAAERVHLPRDHQGRCPRGPRRGPGVHAST